ncbi:MAG TPA: hypothetical protein VIM30_15300 [Candidatus Limnocylindrales bacterium]
MTADPVALLGVVVVLDAVVIAGIVAGRLASLRSARQAATSSTGTIDEILVRDPFTDLGGWRSVTGNVAGDPPTEPPASNATVGSQVVGTDTRTNPDPNDGNRAVDDAARTQPAIRTSPRPLVAVGPGNGSQETDEWRRALQRERARVARYGRVATIMKVELDLESSSSASNGEVAKAEGVLQGLVSTDSRASDFVARTAPGSFHLILPETPEIRAAGFADRIRTRYREAVPAGPELLIGWTTAESPDGRASSAGPAAGDAEPAPGRLPADAAIEASLTTLERIRSLGLVGEEEYRSKRSEILARL